MAERADQLDQLESIALTQLVILPDPVTGKLYKSTVGALLNLVAAPDLSTKADLVSGKVPAYELPSYVDDVLEYPTVADLPAVGAVGVIYVITSGADSGKIYRWSGSIYVNVGGTGDGSDVAAEAATRSAADNTLQGEINAETLARQNADNALTSNLNAEITNRANAGTTLQNNINAEATSRANADTALQNNIDAEANARTNADTSLSNRINTEVSARTAADVTLQSNIDSEASARTAADVTLQNNIDTEASARTAADANLQTQIDLKLNAADYNDRYKGKYTSLAALQAAHPASNAGDYAQVDTGAGNNVINYNWDDEDGWVAGTSMGTTLASTDDLPEGTTNLYFTTARVSTKLDKNAPITAGTKTKITYDANGLVTGGADATSSDIAEGTNLYFTNARAIAAVDISGKVDKVTGKGLSTEDYTTTEKTKLAGIAAGAQVNDPDTTLQGNTFNGANQLVKLDGSGKLPAIDGSQLTNLPASGGGADPGVGNKIFLYYNFK